MHNKTNLYKSSDGPRVLKIFEFFEDEPITLPDDSIILHTDTGVDFLELWVSVPKSSILASSHYDVDLEDHDEA